MENDQRTGAQRGRLFVLAVALLSLFIGGIAGGVVGGGATWLVLTMSRTNIETPTAEVYPPPVPLPVAPVELPAGSDPVVTVVEQIEPTVVTIINRMESQRDFWGNPYEPPQASGSGVIVDPRGYILTNHHVVENAVELTVIFTDGNQKSAQLIGHDYPFSDLALIKVAGDSYPYAILGDSDSLRVGEEVIAIGSALGDLRNTVTTGVVSGVGRSLQVSEDLVMEGMIQTDAAINHGNSGGPLVNLRGEVVGINTAIIRGGAFSGDVAEGLGFAIPSNTARYVVEELVRKGKVTRPYLGVRTTTITRALAAYYNLPVDHGVYVLEVLPGTPAAQAGLRVDDIIIRIGEETIDEEHPLINVLSHYETGQRVTLAVVRNRESVELEIVLGERP